MTYLLLGAILFWLMAIFGILTARFARPHELGPNAAALPPKPKNKDPYALVWWQDLEDLGYEFHLANGEAWRGRLGDSYYRYPDGADESHAVPMRHWNKLSNYRRRIEWREPEIWAQHAHVLVDWAALDSAYQLKLLNGSTWQFNTKSEGLGTGNEMAWRLIDAPPTLRHESLNRIHASLNEHLNQIRLERSRQAAIPAPAPIRHTCGNCSLGTVSIPGGICAACRAAQEPTAQLGRQ